MRIELITRGLIRQVEKFHVSFNAARFGSLRDLCDARYPVEIREFGNTLAVKNLSPQLQGKRRVTGFCAADAIHLDEMLAWYRTDGLRCAIQMCYGEMNPTIFRQFAAAGLVSSGSSTCSAWMDAVAPMPIPSGIVIQESPADDREAYLDLFQKCFAGMGEQKPEYRPIQWAEDGLSAGKRYIAELDGKPIGFASMPIIDGIAICGTAGTLPEFRGRGAQQCLIDRRITDAERLGCSMLLGGADLGGTADKNFTRRGFRKFPLGMSWSDSVVIPA